MAAERKLIYIPQACGEAKIWGTLIIQDTSLAHL